MRFTVQERSGERPVLLAEGMIDADLIPRLQDALSGFSGEEVWLRSPGGMPRIDHDAGRLIRLRGLNTRIPAGWSCRGACNFMFMGGVERFVDHGGLFIADMFALSDGSEDRAVIASRSSLLASADVLFSIGMGVSPRLLSEVMYRQSARDSRSPGRCLTRAELDGYRVTTNTALPRRGRRQ